MKTEKFQSFDGTVLQCYLWDNVRNPKGVVQISHGMAEHARRYDDFANYLNQNGYIVFADDHRAHGMTSTKQSSKGVKGYHKGNIYFDTVKDECAITKMLKDRYSLPVFYLGHSYGSMVGQRYIEECKDYSGVILSGSAMMKGALLNTGATVANVNYKLTGGEKTAKLLDNLFNCGLPAIWRGLSTLARFGGHQLIELRVLGEFIGKRYKAGADLD